MKPGTAVYRDGGAGGGGDGVDEFGLRCGWRTAHLSDSSKARARELAMQGWPRKADGGAKDGGRG